MNKGLVRRSPLSLALLALCCAMLGLVLSGCERRLEAPPLVELTDLGPTELEPGDHLDLRGKGFPQGRTARVRFHGTIFRGGGERLARTTLEAEGLVLAPDRLRVEIEPGLLERVCGAGDTASHATFEGSVEVAFASSTPEAPPVVSELERIRLDWIPASTRASILAARKESGARVLHELGVVPGEPSPRGLPIEQITAGSVATRGGLRVGDVIERVDGLRVLSLADVAPASSRTMSLGLWHPDDGRTETKSLTRTGQERNALFHDVAPALFLVAFGLLTIVLMLLPGPRALQRAEWDMAAKARRTRFRTWWYTFAVTRAGSTALSLASLACFAVASSRIFRELDGLVLFLFGAAMLINAQASDRRGVRAYARRLSATMLFLMVMGTSIALCIVQLGTLELSEAVRLQGGLPWQFSAARHPSCTLASVAFLSALSRVLCVTSHADARDAFALRSSPARARSRLARPGLLFASGLSVALFFGGWAPVRASETMFHTTLGVALFVTKTWLVAAFIDGLSQVLPDVSARAAASLVGWRHVPTLILSALFLAASRWLSASEEVELALGLGASGVAALVLLRILARVRALVAAPEPHASPFL
jgi:hypothetical protein